MKIEGLEELKSAIKGFETIPKKIITKSTRKGAREVLLAARANAPKDTGILRRALYVKGERSKNKLKKVFEVTFNKKYNDKLVKISKEGKRSYYPASIEYGFITKSGAKTQGVHYLRRAAQENEETAKKVIVDNLISNIEKEWAKK